MHTQPITVVIKQQYGNERIYVTSEHGALLTMLTGRKTLDRGDVEVLRKLGFTVELEVTTL